MKLPAHTIERLAPGAYLVNARYELNRTREGALHGRSETVWYWRDRRSPTTRSGYFATKAAALGHLLTGAPEPAVLPPPAPTRGYSRAFPATGDRTRYLLDDIPAEMWARVRERATAERVSMRTLVLQLLSEWLAEGAR